MATKSFLGKEGRKEGRKGDIMNQQQTRTITVAVIITGVVVHTVPKF